MIVFAWADLLELRKDKFKEAMDRHTVRCGGHYRMNEVSADYMNLDTWFFIYRGVDMCHSSTTASLH